MALNRKDLEELMSFAKENGLMDRPCDEVYEMYLKTKH